MSHIFYMGPLFKYRLGFLLMSPSLSSCSSNLCTDKASSYVMSLHDYSRTQSVDFGGCSYPWIRWCGTMLWTSCTDITQMVTAFFLTHLAINFGHQQLFYTGGLHPILLILYGAISFTKKFLFISHILIFDTPLWSFWFIFWKLPRRFHDHKAKRNKAVWYPYGASTLGARLFST